MRKVFIGNRTKELNLGEEELTSSLKYNVRIDEDDGKSYFYTVFSIYQTVSETQPLELHEAKQISWDELKMPVKKAHFKRLHPNGTEQEYNVFVYGEKRGRRINAENAWADKHEVFSRSITLKIRKILGNFSEVELLKSSDRKYVYLLDKKWRVKVWVDDSNSDSLGEYIIEDYEEVKKRKAELDKKAAELVNVTGVPFEVASMVAKKEEFEEAIAILEDVKKSRKNLTEEMRIDFFEGKLPINELFRKVLDPQTICGLNFSKQERNEVLANFLMS